MYIYFLYKSIEYGLDLYKLIFQVLTLPNVDVAYDNRSKNVPQIHYFQPKLTAFALGKNKNPAKISVFQCA